MITQIMDYTNRSYIEALRTTLVEFSYIKRVQSIRKQRKDEEIHRLAWKVIEVQQESGTSKNRRPMFRRYLEFYDYEIEYIRAMYGSDVADMVLEELESKELEEKTSFNKALKNREVNLSEEAKERRKLEIAEHNRLLEERLKDR